MLRSTVMRRWKPFKWWLTLGYWFHAQAWGGRDDTIIWVDPSCWSRVLPASACQLLASFFLMKVEIARQNLKASRLRSIIDTRSGSRCWESWKRITARHQRRTRHPHYCRNPTNLRWCSQPNCDEVADRSRDSQFCPGLLLLLSASPDGGFSRGDGCLSSVESIASRFPSGAAATRAVAIRSLRIGHLWPRVGVAS